MRQLIAIILALSFSPPAFALPGGCALLIRGRATDGLYLAEMESGGLAWLVLSEPELLIDGQRIYGSPTAIIETDLPVFDAVCWH